LKRGVETTRLIKGRRIDERRAKGRNKPLKILIQTLTKHVMKDQIKEKYYYDSDQNYHEASVGTFIK
jgi:hypothetical protein